MHSWTQTDLSEAHPHASDDVPKRLGPLEHSQETFFRITGFREFPLASTKSRIRIRGAGDHKILHSRTARLTFL